MQNNHHHHAQPTMTINLPSSNPNTLIQTTPFVNSNQQISNMQQQQQYHNQPNNFHNQQSQQPQHHHHQMIQQQQLIVQQQQQHNNTNLISNPSGSSPSPSLTNSSVMINNSPQHAQMNNYQTGKFLNN